MSDNPREYTDVFTTSGFAKMVREALNLEAILIADGTPQQASVIRQAVITCEKEVKAIARKIAKDLQQTISAEERTTRVRPSTDGFGGPRLGDFIGVSHPLDTAPGSVGVNHIPTLEAEGVGWWWTVERGYRGHLHRKFIGAFDGTKPDPMEYPVHALLEIGKGVQGSGKGEIKKPIQARHFVRDGMAKVEPRWHAEIQASRAKMMAESRAAFKASSTARRQQRRRP